MDKQGDAAGSLLLQKGYSGINGLIIAKETALDSSLIHNYFGSVDNQIETYIKKTDCWTLGRNVQLQDIPENCNKLDEAGIIRLPQNQFKLWQTRKNCRGYCFEKSTKVMLSLKKHHWIGKI